MESTRCCSPLPGNIPTTSKPGDINRESPRETMAPSVAKSGRDHAFDYEVLTSKEKIVQNFLKQSCFPHDKDGPKLRGTLKTSIYFGTPIIQYAADCIPVCRAVAKYLAMREIVALTCLSSDCRLLISSLAEKYYSRSPATRANYRSLWQSQFTSPPERLTLWLEKYFDKSDKAWVEEDPLRQAALHRYLCNRVGIIKYGMTTIPEFFGSACCMTTLSNGQLVCGSYQAILVCDLTKTGEELYVAILSQHTDWVNSVLELADGQIISCSDDYTLRVWDLSKPVGKRCVAVLREHTSCVNGVLELAGGQIISCSDDRTLRVWDLSKPAGEECVAILSQHTDRINCIAMLSSNQVISGSDDGTLRVWDLTKPERKRCVAILAGHTLGVSSVSMLADGKIISCSRDQTLRVWDLTKPERYRCVTILHGHTEQINGIAVLTDGKIISCSSDLTLRVWDLTNPEGERCVTILRGHTIRVNCITGLANGQVITGSYDRTLRIWDLSAAIDLARGLLPDQNAGKAADMLPSEESDSQTGHDSSHESEEPQRNSRESGSWFSLCRIM